MSKVVFVDKTGKKWTRENLQDLVDGYKQLKSFLETLNYYF